MRHRLKTDLCCLDPPAAHGRAGKDNGGALLAKEDREMDRMDRQVPEVTISGLKTLI